ncbi:hypothetical protein WDU99_02900 [Microbacterium sp. Mu-80]|uniref:Uncharacterized protein n=1 Tax=Microbacterium bandirmense TaxID=3122050 RepID=A0ABU8L7F3_9MICO
MTDQAIVPDAAPGSPEPNRDSSWATALIVAGVLVGGLVIGGTAGWGVTFVQMTQQVQALQGDNDDLTEELAKATESRDRLAGEQDEVITDYTDKLAELSENEAALREREEAVTAKEEKIAVVEASSFSSGMLIVGADVAPGTYRTSEANDCYYAWMSSTSADADIIDNNIISGTATVTLKKGDVFESSTRCGTWTKIG